MSSFWIIQILNGLTLAGLFFIVASGFAITFGVMKIANLAHGALYLFGGWIGVTITQATDNLILALLAAGLGMAVVGLFVQSGLLRHAGEHQAPQVLVTIGVAFVLADIALMIWGGDTGSAQLPDFLNGGISIFGVVYPRFRLALLLIAVLFAGLLYWLQYRTYVGAVLRASVDDKEMVAVLGIRVNRIYTGAFMFGAACAGVGGVLGSSLLGVYTGADWEILVFSLAVVIIGGVGSLTGVIAGSLLTAFSINLGIVFAPELMYFALFGPMALMLALRPQGILGRP